MENKVFIGGLNYDTTEKSLLDALSIYGHVVSIRIVLDHSTGKSKGFGFATFYTQDGAREAIEKFNGAVLGGRRIGVKSYIDKIK